MPLILKAKDIYEQPKSINYKSSRVSNVKLNAVAWEGKFGQVSPTYTNTYFEEDKSGNLSFVNGGTKRDFPITTTGLLETTLYADFTGQSRFKIEKIIDVSANDATSSQDYLLVREINWKKPSNTLDEWSNKQNYSGALKYDVANNTFYVESLDNYDANNNILRTTDTGTVSRIDESFYVVGRYREKNTQAYYSDSSNDTQNLKLSLPENELVCNHVYSGGGNTSWAQKIVDIVYQRYKNGKETYLLKCAVADYYDDLGELKVSAEGENLPRLIPIHSAVVPYTFSSLGERPLSVKKDGTAKSFEVIGRDFKFEGVPWQFLTIQEL